MGQAFPPACPCPRHRALLLHPNQSPSPRGEPGIWSVNSARRGRVHWNRFQGRPWPGPYSSQSSLLFSGFQDDGSLWPCSCMSATSVGYGRFPGQLPRHLPSFPGPQTVSSSCAVLMAAACDFSLIYLPKMVFDFKRPGEWSLCSFGNKCFWKTIDKWYPK